jgi:hypothetical protein
LRVEQTAFVVPAKETPAYHRNAIREQTASNITLIQLAEPPFALETTLSKWRAIRREDRLNQIFPSSVATDVKISLNLPA